MRRVIAGYASWNPVDDTTFCCTAGAIRFPEISKKLVDSDLEHCCQFAETLPTSILIVRNGKILYANPAFLTFSGYTQDEIPGTDLLPLFDDPDKDVLKGSCRTRIGRISNRRSK